MKIYKKDSKGKIRFAEFILEKDTYIVNTGVIGSINIVAHPKQCKGKNIGKSNETSAEIQAEKEMEAKIVKKLKEGYFKTLKEVKESNVILPMLAKEFSKEKHKIDWSNCYVQPKLDGMRCLDTISGKLSRKNTPINTMGHIVVNRPGLGKFAVDGELYAHGLSFQENMKLIKKLRPKSKDVKYHVYDTISELPFIDRYSLLMASVDLSDNLELVKTYRVTSLNEVQKYHKLFLAQGYEGTMIRWGNEGYKINGRSSNLLKYKDFQDISSSIIDIISSEVRPTHGTPVLEYNGKTFKAGVKGSFEFREDLLINKNNYIGSKAEIRFFEWTDEGLPRFPVMVGIRLDV